MRKSVGSVAALAVAMGSAAPILAQPIVFRECVQERNELIAEYCVGLSAQALPTCKLRYEKAEQVCNARYARAAEQNRQTDAIRAKKAAAFEAARQKRAAQTPQ
ncbi:hypothetical protein K9B33_22635 [Sphingobium sp. 3R8]|uniref:hypothetical protein n=1 Tax=Sphingobium sp. 3R8 TaxID=2874921 RepID=UPI001CC96620|nr:hypothetical protein [Sphingobium sp. 3R8]MBZ9650332.1 hypothetical protein [Sphingobium sp. 3R8]